MPVVTKKVNNFVGQSREGTSIFTRCLIVLGDGSVLKFANDVVTNRRGPDVKLQFAYPDVEVSH